MHKGLLRTFLADDSGATAIEYALIAGIVSVSILGGLTQISGTLQGTFASVGSSFPAGGGQ